MIRPSNGTAPFEIPDEPVDGYKVTWYHVEGSDADVHVREYCAVYYINKKWSEFSQHHDSGADIVNTWMMYQNNNLTGRTNEGWTGAWAYVEWGTNRNFSTKKEAIKEVIRQLELNREKFAQLGSRCTDNIYKLLAEREKL
jgi:hypothetical protein